MFGREALQDWAWRIPFLLSIPLILLCVWARSRIVDSPRFQELLKTHKPEHSPVTQVVRTHTRPLLQVIALGFAQNAAGYVGVVYLSTHLTRTLQYDATAVFWLVSLLTLVAALFMPLVGSLSDRFGRKPLLTVGLLSYMVLVPATMWVAAWGSFAVAAVAVAVSMVPFIIVQAVGYPLYAELFPTRVRYSGVSLGFNIAAILGGATAPFVAAWLTTATGSSMAPAVYVMAVAVVGLVTLKSVRETAVHTLTD